MKNLFDDVEVIVFSFEVLMLKVNKEGPLKKDIWRAPGNQSHVRKLSHIMQHGRLVNIANFSVYTAASVIKVRHTSLMSIR